MKLIVGLGNPGKDYENTRHNVGFSFVDYYLQTKKIIPTWSKKFDGVMFKYTIERESVIFFKPHTFMNLSGDAVKKIMNYYQISINDLLIISDDLDLNLGNFKLKMRGSSGGHNGLRDIENKIHSSNYKRLKIGISKSDNINTKDYVLGTFSKNEKEVLFSLFDSLCPVLDDFFHLDFSDLMSKYNRKNR